MELMFNNQDEIDFLEKHLKPHYDVLEWGSGGSTIFIAQRVKMLVSIEHNSQWYHDVKTELKRLGIKNVDYHFVERAMEEQPGMDGGMDEYGDYVTRPTWIRHGGFTPPLYDVIFIDGRARVDCARYAVQLLKPGGIILIHDFFHPNPKYVRKEYEVVLEFLDWIEGAFTLHALKPNGHSYRQEFAELKQFQRMDELQYKKSTSMDNTTTIEEAKKMCWYEDACVNDMNRFFDKEIKNQEITEHMKGYTNLLALIEPKNVPLLDIGTGTAMISEFCKDFQYVGSDLPHIIKGCAIRNYPQYMYRPCDILIEDIKWIEAFPVISLNGVIDIMPNALSVLERILEHCTDYVLIHRQEITDQGKTHQAINGSYSSDTFHSIINRDEWNQLIEKHNFRIIKEERLSFGNWENGGSSFLLKRLPTYSLNKIDHILNTKYFSDKEGGVFIEAGANNGIEQSNTLYFEECKNWRGILIEPIREVWKQCMKNRSRINIFVNAALVAQDYDSEWIEMGHIPDVRGLMSVVKDGNEQKQYDKLNNEALLVINERVPAKTLDEILFGVWDETIPIDLLSLDVEGFEIPALQGINFDKWTINYILIEQREGAADPYQVIKDHYDFVEKITDQDYLYKRKGIL